MSEPKHDAIAVGIAAAMVIAGDVRESVIDGLGDALRAATAEELSAIEAGATAASARIARLRGRLREVVPAPSSTDARASSRARAAIGPVDGAPEVRAGFRPWRAAAGIVTAVLRAPARPDVASDRALGRIVLAETCATLDEPTRDALLARLPSEEAQIVRALLSAYAKVPRGGVAAPPPAASPQRARVLAIAMRRGAAIDVAWIGAMVRGAATLDATDDASAIGGDLARLDAELGRWARAQRGSAA